MAFLIEYQDDTSTYHIKHANACEHCKHKTGNSLAVMKNVLDDDGHAEYTIKFKEIVSLSQLQRLVPYIDDYIEDVIEGNPY